MRRFVTGRIAEEENNDGVYCESCNAPIIIHPTELPLVTFRSALPTLCPRCAAVVDETGKVPMR